MAKIESYFSCCNNMSFFSWFSENSMGPKLFKVPSKCLLISWICWFSLVGNMWGFSSTSYATATANENLANKPYFGGWVLANLEYLLRLVDARSIILGVLIPFLPYIPREMASHWYCWIIFERNKVSLYLMCFKLPLKLNICALQRHILPCWTDFLVNVVQDAVT